MEKKTRVEKTPEEIRANARDRKRRQRERDNAARDELQFQTLDPVDANVERIMAQVAQEPRKPKPPRVPPGPPQPARLPTLHEWLKCLRQIKTQAAAEEIIRVEAAIANGVTEFPLQVVHAE